MNLYYSSDSKIRLLRSLYSDLKENEKLLGSISPKVVLTREKIKGKIREIQMKINEVKST